MIKEQITYEDFDGNEVTETHYFNMSESQLIQLEARHQPGGWGRYLQDVIRKNDPDEVMDLFLEVLRMTYGIRETETNRFRQGKEIFEDFQQSLAYDKFFSDLFLVEGKIEKFMNSVMPKRVQDAAAKMEENKPVLENTGREISVESRESVAEKLANDIRAGNAKLVETPEERRARLQKELDDLK